MIEQLKFRGMWFPVELLKQDLSMTAKCIMCLVMGCCEPEDEGSYCTINNAEMSEYFGLCVRQIQRGVKELLEKGYVIEAEYDGRSRRIRPIYGDKNVTSEVTYMSCLRRQKCHVRGDINVMSEGKETEKKREEEARRENKENKKYNNIYSSGENKGEYEGGKEVERVASPALAVSAQPASFSSSFVMESRWRTLGNLEERKEKFRAAAEAASLRPDGSRKYSSTMVADFVRYWTTHNDNGWVMLFENRYDDKGTHIFSMSGRLATWHKKEEPKPEAEPVERRSLTRDEYLEACRKSAEEKRARLRAKMEGRK